MKQTNNQKLKHSVKGTRLALVTAILLALLILLNVGVGFIPRQWSNFVAESGDAFTISAASKTFFKGLDKDVTIYYVADPSMTYDAQFAPKFRVMLDRYARLSNHVEVLYVDVGNTEFFANYTSAPQEISGSCLIIESEDRFDLIYYDELFMYYFPENDKLLSCTQFQTLTSRWMNMVQSYSEAYGQDVAIAYADATVAQDYGISNFYDAYSEFTAGNNLYWVADAMITAAVDYVTTEDIPTTYILSGHGEAELSENFTKMYLDDLSVRYFQINLDQDGSIPENATTLVLNAPKTDITEKEQQLIADFIAGGGSLILNTTPDATGLPNLMALMGTYGLGATDAIVLDDSLSYNAYVNKDNTGSTETGTETGTEAGTETGTEADTPAEPDAQAEEQTTDTDTETDTAESTQESTTPEADTYPEDYLFLFPDPKHSLTASADSIIHLAIAQELASRYMAAEQQLQQDPDNLMYKAYAEYFYQLYQSHIQNERNYQLLVVGAHPITYQETVGVSVSPIVTTSDKGYLSTDPTLAKHTMAVSATVTAGSKEGCIVWFGFADSYSPDVAEKVYKYNYGFLYGAVDYTGGTQQFVSTYSEIPAKDLGGALDMHWGWLIGIAAFGILALPLGTLITGIVICVKRKRK